MDLHVAESYNSVELEDYWNEVRTLRHHTRSTHSEEDSRSHDDDDGDSGDPFLDELDLPVKDDTDMSDDIRNIVAIKFGNTLTAKQEEALKRRVLTVKSSYRKKRQKGKNQKPDIRNFFSSNDASSTGTRSRSATPDSLDSVSPPRTPPDHHPKSWVDPYLSRSRGSLDSGNHSLVTSSSMVTGHPHSSTHTSTHDSFPPEDFNGRELKNRRHSPSSDNRDRFSYNPDPHWSHLNRSPSLENLAQSTTVPSKEVSIRRQASYAKDLARDVKQYYNNKGIYDINSAARYDTPISRDEIQVIRYKHIGSIHIPHVRSSEKRRSLDSERHFRDVSDSEIVHEGRRRSSSNRELEENGETRVRSASTTDLGFKVINHRHNQEFPDLVLELSRSGQTRIDWLDSSDVEKLHSLALLELDIAFNENNILHRWRKPKKKKTKNYENLVFGVPVENLVEKDHITLPDPYCEHNTPQVILKLISHLERHGIREEGILRVPGNRAKTELLKQSLNNQFYTSPIESDQSLRNASPNELAAVIKHFLRELPQPILTHTYMDAFYKTFKISDLGRRVMALTMLIILLPLSHRDTLRSILDLCASIVDNESDNKMGLYNVAMIMAPNLFLPTMFNHRSKLNLRSEDKEQQLNNEMEHATTTTHLTQLLIKYRDIIWTVPHRLLGQIRRQYVDLNSNRQQNNKPIYRLLNRKTKESIQRPIVNEVDYQEGVLRVSAAQFNRENYPVKLDSHMTARDVLSKFIEDQTQIPDNPGRVEGRREQQLKKHSCPPPMITTCMLRGSLKHALDNHALHERGGNISDRRLDHRAKLLAVYQDNPNAEFIVKCHHPGGQIIN